MIGMDAGGMGCTSELARWTVRRCGSDILSKGATVVGFHRPPTADRVQTSSRVDPRLCPLRVKRHEQDGVYHPASRLSSTATESLPQRVADILQ